MLLVYNQRGYVEEAGHGGLQRGQEGWVKKRLKKIGVGGWTCGVGAGHVWALQVFLECGGCQGLRTSVPDSLWIVGEGVCGSGKHRLAGWALAI